LRALRAFPYDLPKTRHVFCTISPAAFIKFEFGWQRVTYELPVHVGMIEIVEDTNRKCHVQGHTEYFQFIATHLLFTLQQARHPITRTESKSKIHFEKTRLFFKLIIYNVILFQDST
jgi:hypothetical protein